jgi:ketosteroid isomerase-like protein
MGDDAAVVEALYEAFRRGDIDAILGMVDTEVEWSIPRTAPRGGSYKNRAGMLEFLRSLVEAWDSLAVDVEAVGEITPGLVASVIRVSGSLKGHGEVSFGSVQVFTIDDGVIMRMREFVDVDGPVGAPKA